jgi:hypothetical protein
LSERINIPSFQLDRRILAGVFPRTQGCYLRREDADARRDLQRINASDLIGAGPCRIEVASSSIARVAIEEPGRRGEQYYESW